MKLLLDTHIWLWSAMEPQRLSRRVASGLSDPRNELWISPVSTWEIVSLSRKRRVELGASTPIWVRMSSENLSLREAPLTHEVVLAIESVRLPHRDPADALLAATARVYGLTLVTADHHIIAGAGFSVLANR